jgi:hypothetical protein
MVVEVEDVGNNGHVKCNEYEHTLVQRADYFHRLSNGDNYNSATSSVLELGSSITTIT